MACAITLHLHARCAFHPLAWACASLCAGLASTAASAASLAEDSGAAAVQQVAAAAQAGARKGTGTPALKEVVISASRDEQDPDLLPMSVDVINARQMEEAQITDIRELTADIPNVTVPRTPARFSLASGSTGRDQNSGFNIRGLEGNRVLMLVDGVRLPRSYAFSANAFGRDYLDLGLIERVEILRGSTPALYGSDGMGGLVNFITVQPDDLLKDGKTIGGRVSAGYDGSDNGKRLGATLAGRLNPQWSWLISAGLGRGHALENMGERDVVGATRTTTNPESNKSQSLLGRLVYTPSAVQKHVFTLEQVDKHADYNLLSARSATVTDSRSTTDMDRWRATWQGRWSQLDTAVADELQLMASYQKSDSREWVNEVRTAPLAYRERDVTYDEGALQLHAQAGKLLRFGANADGKITYGVDYTRNKVTNEQNGITPPAGESFPLKRFPDTTETSTAAFAQADLHFGAWSITPGLRAEHYKLDASQNGFAPTVANNSDSAISPKLGVMFHASDDWSVYGNYAAGFRAPNAGQVNAFFENPLAYYRSIPNPDLKPEKSQTFELGVRGRVNGLRLDAAAFTGRYKDFIQDQVQISGEYGNPNNWATFQSVNLDRVRISGFEVKGEYDWGRVAGGQLITNAAYGYTDGKDLNTHQALDTISPQQLVLGVRYERKEFGVRLTASHWSGKKAKDTTAGDKAWLSPSATVLDLSAQWRIQPDLRLNVGVYNLTDKKYWRWSDVRNLTASSTIADAYSQPGRHVRVSMVKDF
ncbi:TonB-dependent hemoglobin/transferrin/lactoferrin family receptor [Diaphorobacter caeni]|uniref:TonB-dependent hemoglobin/transferrin/lactoferrin family receptor n=1 Tax=Diaphorobacter caeni TaxID=2784387 RepID=UPI00188FCC6B|nr:TonB-dependent hemoglobin/transferrin/lactoferrin family receptor [Diaphorobacter caeni]MBF5006058.1 TonB-dependent hemoglobin/transferrin/lactoferrin family receptor [Diaphorobacter caeni]